MKATSFCGYYDGDRERSLKPMLLLILSHYAVDAEYGIAESMKHLVQSTWPQNGPFIIF